MPVLDTLGAPLRVRSARHIFQFIERVLHVGLEVGSGIHVLLRK